MKEDFVLNKMKKIWKSVNICQSYEGLCGQKLLQFRCYGISIQNKKGNLFF